jgi:hypothetical protein
MIKKYVAARDENEIVGRLFDSAELAEFFKELEDDESDGNEPVLLKMYEVKGETYNFYKNSEYGLASGVMCLSPMSIGEIHGVEISRKKICQCIKTEIILKFLLEISPDLPSSWSTMTNRIFWGQNGIEEGRILVASTLLALEEKIKNAAFNPTYDRCEVTPSKCRDYAFLFYNYLLERDGANQEEVFKKILAKFASDELFYADNSKLLAEQLTQIIRDVVKKAYS